MKSWLKSLLVLPFVLFSLHVFAQQKTMPDLHFYDTDNVAVGKKNIPKGKALLLIYFRSDCDHCEHTAIKLKTKAKQYPSYIWMVSGEDASALQTFESMMGLYDIPNLKIVQDKNHQMHRFYDFTQLPYILLYSATGKLLKQFDELPSVDVVKQILARSK